MGTRLPNWFLASNTDLNLIVESCVGWVWTVSGPPMDFQSIKTQPMESLSILEHLESDILRSYHPKTTNLANSDHNA